MLREPTPPNPALETLRDRRDHLQIQVSMASDAPGSDDGQIASMLQELDNLEKQIAKLERRHPYIA